MTCSASSNLFVAGIVIFTAASVLSGLAQDPTQLILARAGQGLGAAVLAPQGLPIMLSVFPVERRGGVFAAQPLAMMVTSGIASGLTQKLSAKYLLVPGLLAFAAGLGYIDWAAQAGSGRWTFLPGLILTGLGMGFVWTPVFSLATRDLRPELAGVASGVLNTVQELGSVIASAAVGALLQNRLAAALHDQAVARAGQLPATERDPFVAGFSHAAKSGLEVGAGQTGAALQLPPALQQLAHDVFTNAFVDAMRPTLILPIVIILLAAASCLAVRAGARRSELGEERQPEIAAAR